MSVHSCRKWVWIAAVASVIAACSSSINVYVANPCEDEVQIETKYVDGETIARATIPPRSVAKVESAFQTAAGPEWIVAIPDADIEFRVRYKEIVHSTIVLPATACG